MINKLIDIDLRPLIATFETFINYMNSVFGLDFVSRMLMLSGKKLLAIM